MPVRFSCSCRRRKCVRDVDIREMLINAGTMGTGRMIALCATFHCGFHNMVLHARTVEIVYQLPIPC